MNKLLIAVAALGALGAAAWYFRRYLNGRGERKRDEHIDALRDTLRIKPGPKTVDGRPSNSVLAVAQPVTKSDGLTGGKADGSTGGKSNDSTGGKPEATSGAPLGAGKSAEPPPKKPSMALMVHPDANGLRVNGPWLTTMNCTIEPLPMFGDRKSVDAALARAKRFNADADAARRRRDWNAADEHIRKALAEVDATLKRDHWYAADVLNEYGCVRYDQGFYGEAREIWSQAEQICEDWPSRCAYLLPTVQSNLKRVKNELGF